MTDVMDRLQAALTGKYTFERELGAGGMATVYLAQDLKHDRQVAVKVLRPELAAALGKDRFLQEIRIAASLHHPHILPLFDSGEADGFLYYVMPYEAGQSLRERIDREGELPVSEAVRIVRDIVDALAHAHKQDVVHRDIKPDNIMVSGRHALVTDFGVAKAVSEATGRARLTTAGVALGTPTYMAPEQAAADPHIDHRADVYAVGAVAYELLTGRPPFLGTTSQMILTSHIADEPDPVTKYRASVPPALERLVSKCLEKSPADRWQSAEEMLPHLEALVTPSGAVTPVATKPVAPEKGRQRVTVVTLAVAIVLAGLAIFQLIPRGVGVDLTPNRVVVIPFENRTGDESLDQIGAMAADWLTEGLMALVEIVEPVPTMQVMPLVQRRSGEAPGPTINAAGLPEMVGAGTAVSGSYYRLGDSLEFQAQVLDVVSGTVLGSTEPVRGTVRDPGIGIGLLRQQVTGIVAARFDPLMRVEIPASVRPPTYEAFQAYSAGMRAFVDGNYMEALRHVERASELDSTYTRARLPSIAMYANMGQLAVAESLAIEATTSWTDLSPYDRLRIDLLLAGFRGDRAGAYRAAHQAVQMVQGGTVHFALIGAAVGMNRPAEALEFSGTLIFPEAAGRAPHWHYDNVTSAHHLLGDHEEELAEAERGQESWPSSLPTIAYEVRALAGLGGLEGLRARIEDGLILRPQLGWTPGDLVRVAVSELIVHGHPEEAQNILQRAYEWHERQPPEDAQSPSGRFDFAQTLYLDGRLDEAERLFADLAAESPVNVDYKGYLGAIAARRGERDAAELFAQELQVFEQPYMNGGHTLWRARIASLLGEKDAAVSLLREALSQGREYGPLLHADPDFAPLWDYPPYQELMRPKG